MSRTSRILSVCGALLLCVAMAAPASACPMCKLASESSSRQPRAYMYSILFMMGMPMMLTSGFGIAFYRLSRQAARMQQAEAAAAAETADHPTAEASPAREPNVGGTEGTADGFSFA
jgi:hypothetical protein